MCDFYTIIACYDNILTKKRQLMLPNTLKKSVDEP